MTRWNWPAFWRGWTRGVWLGYLIGTAVLAGWLLARAAAAEPPPVPRPTAPLVWPDPDLKPVIPARPAVRVGTGQCRRGDQTVVACVMMSLEDHAALRVYLRALERAVRDTCLKLGFGVEACEPPRASP